MIIESLIRKDGITKLANSKKLRDFLKGKSLLEKIACYEILEYMYENHIEELLAEDFLLLNHPFVQDIKAAKLQLPYSFSLRELGLTDSHVELLHTGIALKRKTVPEISLTPMGVISLLEEMKLKTVENAAVVSDDIVYSEELVRYSNNVVHYFMDTEDELYSCRKILFQGNIARDKDVSGKLHLGKDFHNETDKKYSLIIITQQGQRDSEFLKKAEELLVDDGMIIYCVQPKFLMADEYSDFRKHHIQNQDIQVVYELKNLNRNSVFGALVFSKAVSGKIRFISVGNLIPSYKKPENENCITVEIDYSEIKNSGKNFLSSDFYINSISRKTNSENDRLFSDVVELGRGCYTSSSKVELRYTNEKTGIKYLPLSGIENGKIKDDIPCLTEILDQEEKYIARKGDFVMSKIANPLRFAQITTEDQILVSANLYILRPKKDYFLPEYFEAYFRSDEGQRQLRSIARGEKTLSVIEVRELKELKILCPNLAEQERFVNSLHKLEAEEKLLEEKLNELRKNKESLLKDLLTK